MNFCLYEYMNHMENTRIHATFVCFKNIKQVSLREFHFDELQNKIHFTNVIDYVDFISQTLFIMY